MRLARGGAASLTATVLPGLVCPSDFVPQNPAEVECGAAWYRIASYAGNGGTKLYPPGSLELRADGVFIATGKYSWSTVGQQAARNAGMS